MQRFLTGVLLGAAAIVVGVIAPVFADVVNESETAFSLKRSVVVPGSPEEIYDAITGDISGWWDHTFSESPVKFHLEAKPGGRFIEIFDESGDGVLHATVTRAERGKVLRFVGPLGLAGKAIHMVHTYEFAGHDDGTTTVTLTVNAAGAVAPGMAKVVDGVWRHFLEARFKPYVEAGKHKAKGSRQ